MKKPATKTKPASYPTLLTGIGSLLEESRRAVVRAANCFMTATYWEVGRRILDFEQAGKRRAEYGEKLLERLSNDLKERHGRWFGVDNLQRFRQFAILHPMQEIYATMARKSANAAEPAIPQARSAKPLAPNSATRQGKNEPLKETEMRTHAKPHLMGIGTLRRISAPKPSPATASKSSPQRVMRRTNGASKHDKTQTLDQSQSLAAREGQQRQTAVTVHHSSL